MKTVSEHRAREVCPTLEHLKPDLKITGFYVVTHKKPITPCGHDVQCYGIGACGNCANWFARCKHCRPAICPDCLEDALPGLRKVYNVRETDPHGDATNPCIDLPKTG